MLPQRGSDPGPRRTRGTAAERPSTAVAGEGRFVIPAGGHQDVMRLKLRSAL